MNKEIAELTALASMMTLPRSSPSEFPAKPMRKLIRKNVKNCSGVLDRRTNQYTIKEESKGKKTR